jgi:LacI family transcriptional regulator
MSVRQIAQLAGVSFSTVSLALNDSPKISAKTKLRIRQLAAELNYQPNPKINELMSHLRSRPQARTNACLGAIAFYDTPRPWEHRPSMRTFNGMQTRAKALGYRLESFWPQAPGMTLRRLRSILDARGIQGLLCFGSSDFEARFPEELDCYAIVTIGLSIQTPLHRIISHFYADTTHTLNKLCELGYRRPGLVVRRDEEIRCNHTYTGAYLAWCDYILGAAGTVPVLRLENTDLRPMRDWLDRFRPDALVVVHLHDQLKEIETVLRDRALKVPDNIGVAVVSTVLDGTHYSGVAPHRFLMGTRAVDLLVNRIENRDFGFPTNPRIEMVEGHWVDGFSLRRTSSERRTRRAEKPARTPG